MTTTTYTSTLSPSTNKKSPQANSDEPIVHPQYSSNRVNPSTTTNKKPSPTTTTATVNTKSKTTSPATQQILNTKTTKLESKKVNLNNNIYNNKDGNEKVKKEERSNGVVESKQQDAIQISSACQHIKTNSTSPLSKQKTIPVASNVTHFKTTNERDKNDQFALNNIANNYLLSVASANNKEQTGGDSNDKKQHVNNKQSDKHLPGHIHFKQTTTAVVPGFELLQKQINNNSDKKNEDQQTNNCYAHDKAKSTNNKATTKSLASKLKQNNHHNNNIKNKTNDAHALNDCIRPKPMGQQVLSLMMLDVGLMPANNHNQQQKAQSDKSHVSVQSPSNHDMHLDSQPFFIDNAKTISHYNSKDAVNRFNCGNIIDYRSSTSNFKQCDDYHSLQLTSNVNQMLQLHLTNESDGETHRSISLPCSPRLTRLRAKSENRFNQSNDLHEQTNEVEFIRLHRNPSARSLIDEYKRKQRLLKEPLHSNNMDKSNVNYVVGQNQQSLFACDNHDNHSLASSSCSSINHCPPLLALPDHLDGIKFNELLNSRLELDVASTKSNKNDNIKSEKIQSTTKQIVQITKQQDKLTDNFRLRVEKQISGNIEAMPKIQQSHNTLNCEEENMEQTWQSKHLQLQKKVNDNFQNSDSQPDLQLRLVTSQIFVYNFYSFRHT